MVRVKGRKGERIKVAEGREEGMIVREGIIIMGDNGRGESIESKARSGRKTRTNIKTFLFKLLRPLLANQPFHLSGLKQCFA